MPLLVLLAAASALLGTAPASATAQPAATGADVNGDGVEDQVVLQRVEDEPENQELVVTVNGERLVAKLPVDPHVGVRPPRVVDLDDNGSHEIAVVEQASGDVLAFSVWGLFDGLRAVSLADGTKLYAFEGGGASALNGYGCAQGPGGREFVTAGGWLRDWNEPRVYEGDRTTYAVRDGIATRLSTTPVVGEPGVPGYRVDPAACD
ncbi:hypothetical protein [Saccharothrix coeruleofusca]|uniref:hypothetical protein n=1 Tax=Saccharothrix coeruleofusca TaxID=33919 RepID=UPI001670B2AC|nr:hypothetical protein [Saccharothrix coeruleofusca]